MTASEQEIETQHQMLRDRDRLIGLEATAATQTRVAERAKETVRAQRERIGTLRTKVARLERRLRELEQRVAAAEAERNAVLGSRTWRWGRWIARPLRGRR